MRWPVHVRANCGISQTRQRRVDLLLMAQKIDDRVLLQLKFVGRRLEAIFCGDQSTVQFVVRQLQISHAIFVSRLHLLIAMILGRDDAILEDHIDRRERDPAEKDERETSERCLERWSKGKKLHAPVAADVDLALRKSFVEPRPKALTERSRHSGCSLVRVFCADPNCTHFTQLVASNQAFAPEKRTRAQSRSEMSSLLTRIHFSALAAASTASTCPGTLTLCHISRITPLASTRNVARSIPMYFRPYMLFCTQTP